MMDVKALALTAEQLRNRCDSLYTRCWDLEQQIGRERAQWGHLIQENERLVRENAELRRKGLNYAPASTI